jgi:mRNA interferase RelE/StbE
LASQVEFDDSAKKDLAKLDKQTARRITEFLRNRVAPLDDPRSLGHALRGSELGEFWRYRVGDYRLICEIQDRALRVLVLSIGHRREIYR